MKTENKLRGVNPHHRYSSNPLGTPLEVGFP